MTSTPSVLPPRRLAAAATAALAAAWVLSSSSAASGARHDALLNAPGRWYAEGGAAEVEISQCGAEICGRVVWLRSPFDEEGCDLRDRRNPNSALRDRPLLGLEILRAANASDAAANPCSVYDPVSGRTYQCQIWADGPDRLRLRGYLGLPLLGRTTTWLRVGAESRTCRQTSDHRG